MAANKPNFKTIKETAERFDIELPKGTVKVACEAVQTFFKENFDPEIVAECPVCKYEGPDIDSDGNEITECPFCGTPFTGGAAPADEKPASTPKATSSKGASAKNKKDGKEKEPEKEKHIVTDEQQKALDEAIEEIEALQADRARQTFSIGSWLVKIHDENLWKGMLLPAKDKDGKDVQVEAKNFFAFVKSRLDISRSGAYKYMLCARNFTEDQFADIGIKKAELIAAAPEGHRDALISAVIDDGASHVELKNRLAKLEGKNTSGGAGSTSGGVKTLAALVKEGDIQVPWISVESHQPVKRGNVKNKYAKVQLPNGHHLFISHDANGMGITVNFRKDEGGAPTTPATKDDDGEGGEE